MIAPRIKFSKTRTCLIVCMIKCYRGQDQILTLSCKHPKLQTKLNRWVETLLWPWQEAARICKREGWSTLLSALSPSFALHFILFTFYILCCVLYGVCVRIYFNTLFYFTSTACTYNHQTAFIPARFFRTFCSQWCFLWCYLTGALWPDFVLLNFQHHPANWRTAELSCNGYADERPWAW